FPGSLTSNVAPHAAGASANVAIAIDTTRSKPLSFIAYVLPYCHVPRPSRYRDLANGAQVGPLRNPRGEHRERLVLACGLDRPPDRVRARRGPRRARCDRRDVPERAVEALPGGEGDRALGGLVDVGELEHRHSRTPFCTAPTCGMGEIP